MLGERWITLNLKLIKNNFKNLTQNVGKEATKEKKCLKAKPKFINKKVKTAEPQNKSKRWVSREKEEKKMATHSIILPGKIPQREEAGGLQSMGSQRVRHDQACMNVKEKEVNKRYNAIGNLINNN